MPSRRSPAETYYYLFERDLDAAEPVPQMTGNMLKLKGTQQDFDTTSGEPIVTMQFTGAGNKRFHEITREEAIRGRTLGQPQHFAIVLDNELRSFPQIDYQRYPDGIDPTGGGAQITGLASLGEAKRLALVLQTGALPVKFVTVERTDVSATLGKDSLREARNAAIAGLLLVVIFLLAIYRFLGVVAVLGLAVYAALMYGAILLLGVTLTLPGFAGLILTIGVAADANIVIFERIKEEARAGRSVRAAIAAGYAKGFHTILDANAVTCITALVLFAVATASVKGFALMLLIGTVVSLADRRRRDARDARTARRVQVVRQPALHGRDLAGDPEVAADRRRRPPAALVHPLARRDRPQHRRASPSRASTSASTSRAASRSRSRPRSRPRSPTFASRRRRSGTPTRSSRDAARRPGPTSTRASRSGSRSSTRPSSKS